MDKIGRQFGAVRSFRDPGSSHLAVQYPQSTVFMLQSKSWFIALPSHPCFSSKKERKRGRREAGFKEGFICFSSVDISGLMMLYC